VLTPKLRTAATSGTLGVDFDTDADLGIEVTEAIGKGMVPKTPLAVPSDRRNNSLEQKVQRYLQANGMKSSFEYQSVFVVDDSCEKLKRSVVTDFGEAFVLKPALANELVVASIGDLQNLVDSISGTDRHFSESDERIVGLTDSSDKRPALLELAQKAAVLNSEDYANPIVAEARLNRLLKNDDLLRPCTEDDFR